MLSGDRRRLADVDEPGPEAKDTWLDLWMTPTVEVIAGCILLVLSGVYFWATTGAVWETWGNRFGTFAVVLGPYFVHRAWNRKSW